MNHIEAIYPVEEWNITEETFDIKNNYRNETTFALSNGYIGTRGTLEEGYDFDETEGLEGNFINGFYESEHIRYGEWNFGFPTESQSLLNLPNLKTTQIYLGEEKMDLRKGIILDYKRVLHMKEGFVSRDFTWQSPRGRKVKVHMERLVSFTNKNGMAIHYEIEPLNFNGEISLISKLQGNVENHTRTTNPLVDYGPFGRHLIADRVDIEDDAIHYLGTTRNSQLSMCCGSLNCVYGEIENKRRIPYVYADGAEIKYILSVKKGSTIVHDKYIAYTSCLDLPDIHTDQVDCKNDGDIMKQFICDNLASMEKDTYQNMKKAQIKYMADYWDKADVVVLGDPALQQGIRFNLFHIMQAAGRDGRTGMGAKGLTGEGYEGHYFWDTEMYVMPVFIFSDAKLAKSLLDYRYSTLNEARERAHDLGHPKGALYPWRTINGREASTYFPLGTAQYHINADIAYAFKLYVDVTGDTDYLIHKAAEVLIETARVWADVGCFAESRDNKYCICSVTGPDEYNAIVDNNFYTNLMARENIKDAIWALGKIKEVDEVAYNELTKRLALESGEVEYWQRIVDNMYFPYDEKRKIYPLDDGFMQRKPWDDSRIPPQKCHLLYENYHPLFVYRQRMSKQADAILGMLLHSNYFTNNELKRNYDFYQEVTLHHSSLSTCIFGILASQIGYDKEAYEYFTQSARMDLDDYHHNFYAGIHAANMAGTWQGIVFGFAGLRTNDGGLSFLPHLPKEWKRLTFKVDYQGSRIKVDMVKGKTIFTLQNDRDVTFRCDHEKITLNQEIKSHTKEC